MTAMADETLKQLQDRIESLERLVATMRGRGGDDPLNPFPRVFLARAATSDDTGASDPASGTWVEQTVNDGEVADFPDGRRSVAENAASNLINALGGAFAVIEIIDRDADGNLVNRYVPIRSTQVVQVRITGNQPGGGKYNGKIYQGEIAPTDDTTWLAADLAMPEDGMTLPQDEDCIVINMAENNETSHAITAAGAAQKLDHWGLKCGVLNDNRAIVAIFAQTVYTCVTS